MKPTALQQRAFQLLKEGLKEAQALGVTKAYDLARVAMRTLEEGGVGYRSKPKKEA